MLENLAIVDVQPCYHKYCGPVVKGTIDLIEEAANVKMFWVGDGLSEDTVESVQEYWLDAGLSWQALERIDFIEKGYGWLRPWMDQGVPEEVVINTIKALLNNRCTDTRDLDSTVLGALRHTEDIPGWSVRIPADPIFLPPFSLDPFKGRYWHLCGGANYECLAEVELTLQGYGVEVERIHHLVW